MSVVPEPQVGGPLTLGILDTVEEGPFTLGPVALVLGASVDEVDAAARAAVHDGLLTASVPAGATLPQGVDLRLTDAGRQVLDQRRRQQAERARELEEAREQARVAAEAAAAQERLAREQAAADARARYDAARERLLVGDAAREETTQLIGQAYAENRIDLAETERRSAAALAARTRAELQSAVVDLVPPAPPDAAPDPPAYAGSWDGWTSNGRPMSPTSARLTAAAFAVFMAFALVVYAAGR